MVVAGTRQGWSCFGMDYGGANDLFGVGPRVAESRVDCAGPIAGNGNRICARRRQTSEGSFFAVDGLPYPIEAQQIKGTLAGFEITVLGLLRGRKNLIFK